MRATRDDAHYLLSTGSPSRLCTDPPWHVSQVQQPESAMRSMQSSVSLVQARSTWQHDETPQPPALSRESSLLRNQIHPSNLHHCLSPSFPTFTPINAFHLRTPHTDSNAFYMRHARIVPGLVVDMYEYSTIDEIEDGQPASTINRAPDTDEDDDRVYHVGHIPGETFSGTFKDDDPNELPHQAVHFIHHMQQKQLQPIRSKRSFELLTVATKLIEDGASLVLQRTSFVQYGEAVLCLRPGCRHEAGIPPDHYYVQLDGDDASYRYCLQCFERLWKGDYTSGEHTVGFDQAQSCQRRDSVTDTMIPQYDGTADAKMAGLYSSIWADPEDERVMPDPDRTSDGYTGMLKEDSPCASPSSVTSDPEGYFPLTPFQHIATSVKPGDTLSGLDKAALAYWKFVSRVQLKWQTYMREKGYTCGYYRDLTVVGESLTMSPTKSETDKGVDEDNLEAQVGLQKEDVYGLDLSEVLKKAAEKRRKEAVVSQNASASPIFDTLSHGQTLSLPEPSCAS